MPLPRSPKRDHWSLPATSLQNTGHAQEALPKVLGHSHQETALANQQAVGSARTTLEAAAPPKQPFTESIEAFVKLEARMTMQQAHLETAIVGSFNEVANVCTHLVRQCDALATQMTRLEVFVVDNFRPVSPCSHDLDERQAELGVEGKQNVCEMKLVNEEKKGEPHKIDQGTQTKDGNDAERFEHAELTILREPHTGEPDDLRLSLFSSCGSPPGSPGRRMMKRNRDFEDIPEHQEQQRNKGRPSGRPSYGSSFLSQSVGSSCSEAQWTSQGLFGKPYAMPSPKRNPARKSGKSLNDFLPSGVWGSATTISKSEVLMEPGMDRTGSTGLEIDLNVEGTAATLMFGAAATNRANARNMMSVSEPSCALPRYYKTHLWATQVALHPGFLRLSLWVVFFNAVYIGIEAQENPAKSLYHSHRVYVIMSNLFCAFYVMEWILHMLAVKHPRYVVTRASHLVDTVLAFVTALDTWVIEPLLFYNDAVFYGPAQIVRLVFLARFARFVKAVPELLTLTRGVVMATRAVFWTGVMVAILTYMFGIVMFTILEDEHIEMGERNFESLENSMWTLLMDGALIEEFGVKMTALRNARKVKTTIACCAMSCYMFITFLTILNMLIGVMNEVVISITRLEKTERAITLMRQTILKQLLKVDDGNGLISQHELERVLTDEESEEVLRSLNVDRLFLLELQQMLFPHDDSQVTISTVVELMLLCRGDNQTTVRTLASGLLYISSLIYKLEATMKMASFPSERDSPKYMARVF